MVGPTVALQRTVSLLGHQLDNEFCLNSNMIKRSHWLRLSILCTSGLLILVISPIAVELLLKLYSEHVARYVQRSATVSHTDSDFVSMCGGNADDRGPHQKVIAYSLYGNFSMKTVLDRYFNPFKVTIDAVHQYFPGNHFCDKVNWFMTLH